MCALDPSGGVVGPRADALWYTDVSSFAFLDQWDRRQMSLTRRATTPALGTHSVNSRVQTGRELL
jgi:hypothetical protein